MNILVDLADISYVVVMNGQSTRLPIEFKQKYTLPSWKTSSVSGDPAIPDGSFGFYNGVDAACVVYMDTGGDQPTPSTSLFTNLMLWD